MEEIKAGLASFDTQRDRGWYPSRPWSQRLLDGIVENDNVPSMRTLAHIYDNVKVESPTIGCLCALQGQMRARSARIRFKDNSDSYGLISVAPSSAVCGRRDNPEAPAVSHRRLQRRRCPGLRCDRCGPRDRPQVRMIRILGSRRCSGIDGWPRQGRPSRVRPRRQRSLLR